MSKIEHRIELTRTSQKTLNKEKLSSQLQRISQRAVAGNRTTRGWGVRLAPHWDLPVINSDGSQQYVATLLLKCEPQRRRKQESLDREFDQICKVVTNAGNGPGWTIKSVDGNNEAAAVANSSVTYSDVEIPEDWRKHFAHIYGRDEQISLMMGAVLAGIKSNWSNRFHTIMIGIPSSGKSAMCTALVEALGSDACLQYDATATTQAGAIEDLRSRAELPRLLVIEEIEKTDENSLRWLLGVLDDRAVVRKVTFRQDIKRECRMLAIATVNDYPLFLKMMDGALASRFCNPIYCPPPDNAILTRILEREVDAVKGNRDWILPTLRWAGKQTPPIHDPRRLKSICLCGEDDLFDGTYQAKLEKCKLPENFFSAQTSRYLNGKT